MRTLNRLTVYLFLVISASFALSPQTGHCRSPMSDADINKLITATKEDSTPLDTDEGLTVGIEHQRTLKFITIEGKKVLARKMSKGSKAGDFKPYTGKDIKELFTGEKGRELLELLGQLDDGAHLTSEILKAAASKMTPENDGVDDDITPEDSISVVTQGSAAAKTTTKPPCTTCSASTTSSKKVAEQTNGPVDGTPNWKSAKGKVERAAKEAKTARIKAEANLKSAEKKVAIAELALTKAKSQAKRADTAASVGTPAAKEAKAATDKEVQSKESGLQQAQEKLKLARVALSSAKKEDREAGDVKALLKPTLGDRAQAKAVSAGQKVTGKGKAIGRWFKRKAERPRAWGRRLGHKFGGKKKSSETELDDSASDRSSREARSKTSGDSTE